jgi:hypothetical protein
MIKQKVAIPRLGTLPPRSLLQDECPRTLAASFYVPDICLGGRSILSGTGADTICLPVPLPYRVMITSLPVREAMQFLAAPAQTI